MADRSRPMARDSRRHFLRAIVAGAASGGALLLSPQSAVELQSLMSRARADGKPPLTLATLNALLRSASAERDRATLKRAETDVIGFVRSRFTLTARQERDLASLTSEELGVIRTAINAAIRQGELRGECEAVISPASRGQVISTSQRFQASIGMSNSQTGQVTLSMAGF